MAKINIALISIAVRPNSEFKVFPMGLAFVASAMMRDGFDFDIIDIEAHRFSDGEVESLLGKKEYDIVAFGALVSGYKYVKNIAAITRRTNPNAVIIAGNSVATSITEHLLFNTEVDIAVKGEGEITIVALLQAIEKHIGLNEVPGIVYLDKHKMINTGYAPPIKDISTIPFPNWNLFDMDSYFENSIFGVPKPYHMSLDQIKAFPVNTARGCPFRCTFCYHVFQYTKYRFRSPESIVSEIKTLQSRYGVNYVNFFDELTFPNKSAYDEFADCILKAGIDFYWDAMIRSDFFTEEDMDLLHKIKESGCRSLGYSLESADPQILKAMNKKLTAEQFVRQKKALDKANIATFTSVVIGYPQETLDTIKKTFDLCYELGIYPSVGYLLPQPGTPMFDIAVQKGLVQDLESYLTAMGDRQDLRFNLTSIPDDVLETIINEHIVRLNDKLNLGLSKEKLIKTGSHITSGSTQ